MRGRARRIGVTMRVDKKIDCAEERDSLSKDWYRVIDRVMPNSLLIPLINHPDGAIRIIKAFGIDGVILSGGDDWGISKRRDNTEIEIIKYCLKRGIPLLGVCRGMQVLNIYFGGKLETGISGVIREKHVRVTHNVEISGTGPFWNRSRGSRLRVNSYHDQGIVSKGVSARLRVFAGTRKGAIEGIYHPKKAIVGIQWHPERKTPSKIFDKMLMTSLFNNRTFNKA